MIITLTPLSFWVSVWWELIYFSVIPCILSFAYLIIEKWYYQDLRMITLGNAKRYLFKSSKTLTGLTLLIATALRDRRDGFVYTISMHTVNSDGPVDF